MSYYIYWRARMPLCQNLPTCAKHTQKVSIWQRRRTTSTVDHLSENIRTETLSEIIQDTPNLLAPNQWIRIWLTLRTLPAHFALFDFLRSSPCGCFHQHFTQIPPISELHLYSRFHCLYLSMVGDGAMYSMSTLGVPRHKTSFAKYSGPSFYLR